MPFLQTELHSILEITPPDFYTLCHATKIKIYCHIKLLVMMIKLTPNVSGSQTFLTVTQKNKLPWFCDPFPTRYLITIFWSNFMDFTRQTNNLFMCRVSRSRDIKPQISSSCISKKDCQQRPHSRCGATTQGCHQRGLGQGSPRKSLSQMLPGE